MEELTVDNFTKSTVSSDNDCNLSPSSSLDGQEYTKEDDNRIACSNSKSLDMIVQIVSSYVSQCANSLGLGAEHSQFTSRLLEIFKDTIQENVTINGLPYVADNNFLTPANNEVLTNETREALLSSLSKKIQDVCAKRKRFPKEYVRIHKMRLHHEYLNVKRARVTHDVRLPSVSRKSFSLDSLSSETLEETSVQIISAQRKLLDSVKELNEIRKNIEYAEGVATKEESFCDTGYISS